MPFHTDFWATTNPDTTAELLPSIFVVSNLKLHEAVILTSPTFLAESILRAAELYSPGHLRWMSGMS